MRSSSAWLVVAQLLEKVLGAERTRRLSPLLLLVLPTKLLIVGRTITWSELAGAVLAYIRAYFLSRYPRSAAPVAGLIDSLLILRGLAPYHWSALPIRSPGYPSVGFLSRTGSLYCGHFFENDSAMGRRLGCITRSAVLLQKTKGQDRRVSCPLETELTRIIEFKFRTDPEQMRGFPSLGCRLTSSGTALRSATTRPRISSGGTSVTVATWTSRRAIEPQRWRSREVLSGAEAERSKRARGNGGHRVCTLVRAVTRRAGFLAVDWRSGGD